jgi:hypothetical protein
MSTGEFWLFLTLALIIAGAAGVAYLLVYVGGWMP